MTCTDNGLQPWYVSIFKILHTWKGLAVPWETPSDCGIRNECSIATEPCPWHWPGSVFTLLTWRLVRLLLWSQPGLGSRAGPPLALLSPVPMGNRNRSLGSHCQKGSRKSKVKFKENWNQDSLTFHQGIHGGLKNRLFSKCVGMYLNLE